MEKAKKDVGILAVDFVKALLPDEEEDTDVTTLLNTIVYIKTIVPEE